MQLWTHIICTLHWFHFKQITVGQLLTRHFIASSLTPGGSVVTVFCLLRAHSRLVIQLSGQRFLLFVTKKIRWKLKHEKILESHFCCAFFSFLCLNRLKQMMKTALLWKIYLSRWCSTRFLMKDVAQAYL